MPDRGGHSLPFYWRMTFFGRDGILEIATTVNAIVLTVEGGVASRPLPEVTSGGYFEGFLKDIRGESGAEDLSIAAVIKASRTVLRVQKAADENAHDLEL